MNTTKTTTQRATGHGTLMSYTIGFVFSVYLTITAYLLVTRHVLADHLLITTIIGLALLQFAVQLLYFLHLGSESKPRWKLLVFLFMLMVVLILVLGSLWIMSNLNYHHVASPSEVNTYIQNQDGL